MVKSIKNYLIKMAIKQLKRGSLDTKNVLFNFVFHILEEFDI